MDCVVLIPCQLEALKTVDRVPRLPEQREAGNIFYLLIKRFAAKSQASVTELRPPLVPASPSDILDEARLIEVNVTGLLVLLPEP